MIAKTLAEKSLAALALFLALAASPVFASGQQAKASGATYPGQTHPSVMASNAIPASPTATQPAAGSCENGNCDFQPSHITVATAAPAPAPWPVQDRILWGANILLALAGYAGIMLAISLLKKIERQTGYAETAAQAAADSAQAATDSAKAALLHAQAIIGSERPWVLITIVPSRSIENGFTVIATNRGRGPAQVVAAVEETIIAVDETHLPELPEYRQPESESPFVSIILLPGEFMNIKSFCRDDVKTVCGSEDALKRIENWEERVFLYGKVVYRDLSAPASLPPHETGWCCRYIHGRQKSGLVMAGSQEYNVHS